LRARAGAGLCCWHLLVRRAGLSNWNWRIGSVQGRNSGIFCVGCCALGLCSVVFKGIIVFEGTMVCMLGSVLYFRW
jgi:hypothetical protein